MTYSFHPEAEEELNHAVAYYEESQPHLGMEFADEVFQTIHRIMDFPNAWQIMHEDIRRCLTKRFPYFKLHKYFNPYGESVIVFKFPYVVG